MPTAVDVGNLSAPMQLKPVEVQIKSAESWKRYIGYIDQPKTGDTSL